MSRMATLAGWAMRDIIGVVPVYNGYNIPLRDFLEGCDLAFSMVDPNSELVLVRLLRSKLEGEVRKFIAGEQFNTLEEFKQYLKEYYHSSSSIYQLQGALGVIVQKKGENVISYANRVKELALKIVDTYRIRNSPTPEALETFRNSTNESAMECFKRGLKEEIKQKIGNPATLRAMVREATEIERENEAVRMLRQDEATNYPVNRERSRLAFPTYEAPESKTCNGNCNQDITLEQNSTEAACCVCSCNFEGPCRECGSRFHNTKQCAGMGRGLLCRYCNGTHHSRDCHEFGHNSYRTPVSRTSPYCGQCGKWGHAANFCRFQGPPRGVHSAMAAPEERHCDYCNRKGHTIENCYTRMREERPKQVCKWCQKSDHDISECKVLFPPDGSRPRTQLYCENCNLVGHEKSGCPRREYYSRQCSHCNMKGHTIEFCRKRRPEGNSNQFSGNEQRTLASGQGPTAAQIRLVAQSETPRECEYSSWN